MMEKVKFLTLVEKKNKRGNIPAKTLCSGLLYADEKYRVWFKKHRTEFHWFPVEYLKEEVQIIKSNAA